ncbi:MAG: polymer-forming cytoskeletal protein [Hyphomicrobiaceae bacterium]|nr:polymer-forming cytoskeletal protein [Hyphomicrobiaceae bacterium]
MSTQAGVMIVTAETAIKGTVRRCRRLEVMGYVNGEVVADEIIVHRGGRIDGKIKARSTSVAGTVEGDIVVDGLLQIAETGSVNGTVQYGKLAMDAGADLVAEVRNVPPRIEGDFEISVQRGRQARITLSDISAVDPDDVASALVFDVSNETHGNVAMMGDRSRPAKSFTQADLIGGRVSFLHDGSEGSSASFDVVVRDASGGTSGEAKTVKVTVVGSTASSSLW